MAISIAARSTSNKKYFLKYLKITTLLTTLSILALVLVRIQTAVPVALLTRDPAAIANHSPFYGAVSNIGIQLWTASAVVCFMGAALVHAFRTAKEQEHFLLVFGCFSAILGLDDLFMLHELVFPKNIGIGEEFVLLAYVIAFPLCCFRFRKQFLRMQPLLFLLSIVPFALSIGFDTVISTDKLSEDNIFWIEDGFKFMGILLWSFYFTWVSVRSVLMSVDALLADKVM